jgi:myo-inositol-1(or 4)-monophosphatase
MSAPLPLPELRDLAEHAAREAGALLRDERPADLSVTATKSSPTDVVTSMDTAAEALLVDTLFAVRPDDGLLGEEGGLRPGTSGVTWVVDPIDGTVNYLYGIPAYAVSVAAVTGEPDPGSWSVLAGCVHNPATGETWTAAAGLGATLDGRRVCATRGVPLERALVGTGFGYTVERRREQARVLAALLPQVRDVRRAGAASLDLCAVACGRLDAYYERGLKPWDLAAGALVATESGATVSGLSGLSAGEAMVLAAAPDLARRLGSLLVELGPHRDAL